MIALVPAKSTSTRIPDKNIRPLAAHPLMAHTIALAVDSGLFSRVIVSTDSEGYAEIARHYGAEVPFLRPPGIARPDSTDFEWVFFTLRTLWEGYERPDSFAILRPTSPFRTVEMLKRAQEQFEADKACDSIRAVQPVREHPGKMWMVQGNRMHPLLPFSGEETPWHSHQTQSLPVVYVQNASLEMAWTTTVFLTKTISGHTVAPFFTQGYEGFDINDARDWEEAERLASRVKLCLS